jgi:hypothetical protein
VAQIMGIQHLHGIPEKLTLVYNSTELLYRANYVYIGDQSLVKSRAVLEQLITMLRTIITTSFK